MVIFSLTVTAFAESKYLDDLKRAKTAKGFDWGMVITGGAATIAGTVLSIAGGRDHLALGLSLAGGGVVVGGLGFLLMPIHDDKIRRYEYLHTHPDITKRSRVAIENNTIYLGMPEEHVIASIGEPTDRKETTDEEGPLTMLYYKKFKLILYIRDGKLVDWKY
jgi:hypothetical protein